jgi:spore germination protein GerM
MNPGNGFTLFEPARRDPMNDPVPSARKRLFLWLLGALLVGCVVILPFQNAEAETESNKISIHLYFADRNNSFLKSELRVMLQPDDPLEFGRTIVEALIKGPQKGLIRTIPVGTELSAIYIDPDDVCYVDLSESIINKHPGGTNSELLTIYSVVNSLILNVSEISRVKILIDGNEAPTLAGHINLQFPFKAHMLLIR